jgi:hypothetical protein
MGSTANGSHTSTPALTAADMAARVDAVERLTKLFKLERLVHLSVTCISLLMLLTSAGVLLVKKEDTNVALTGLFSSSGLITYSANRLLFMWNQALRLLGADNEKGNS